MSDGDCRLFFQEREARPLVDEREGIYAVAIRKEQRSRVGRRVGRGGGMREKEAVVRV